MSHVLIVDDNEQNRYLLRMLLQGHGYSVDEAPHGAQALMTARQHAPNLIISDLLMPVMDGFSLLRQWKSDDHLASIPFVVYTATYTDSQDQQLALNLGADAFLLKPAEPEKFLERIQELLSREQRGELHSTVDADIEENVLLKQYNEVLVRKLEEKVSLLEETNRNLQDEIAEHKQAKEELQRASVLLKAVTDGTVDAIFIKDREGHYLLCNPAAGRFMGQDSEHVVGRTDRDFFNEDDARQIIENDRCVLETNCAQTREEVLTAAGVTRTFLATKAPFRDVDGGVIGIIGVSRDITARKQAEEALRDREERLDLLLNSTAEAIYGVDVAHVCTFANRACAQMLGYENPAELIGRDIHVQMHRCAHAQEECEVFLACRDGKPCHLENVEFWRKDGTRFIAEFFLHPVFREDVNVGAVATFLDVTNRIKLEEQLRHAQKMEAIGRLAGGVAHDFNNLLSVIIGYTDLALIGAGADGTIRGELEQVRLAANKAATLTGQLLAFSRRQVLKPQVLQINDIICESEKLLRRLIGEDVELAFIPQPGIATVLADAGQIEQVIMNLVVNARDAMPMGGRITIRTAEIGSDQLPPDAAFDDGARYVMIELSDTGLGMDPETLSKIFEPFYTTKEPGQGTGLGLATVYGIVEQSGGHITVLSEPGQGTTFKILFPAAGAQESENGRTRVSRPAGGNETILLVEDDTALRELTRRVLAGAGYHVIPATHGLDALNKSGNYNDTIHLVLTDVVMPNMSGRELADKLLAQRPALKVIYMSGFTDDAIVRHGISQDQIEFIQKPFSSAQLVEQVRRVFDSVEVR